MKKFTQALPPLHSIGSWLFVSAHFPAILRYSQKKQNSVTSVSKRAKGVKKVLSGRFQSTATSFLLCKHRLPAGRTDGRTDRQTDRQTDTRLLL